MKLGARRRTYLREATATLAIARLAIRFMPPSRIFAWANRPLGRINRFAVDEVDWIFWAVERISAKPWMNALCLPSALAAHAMLRRRGIASRLCLGVARDGSELSAHAWIEVGEDKVVRDPEVRRFTRLAEFGGIR
ncbi:MAG TPA: lasso peptide biosynthesis B2 protein [Pseudolabrys sp.]|jgi:transglutaminase-like putative cysteine protease|nr:lasso peptide biosynthesis B2 protein [Pseudolabrys sp.]